MMFDPLKKHEEIEELLTDELVNEGSTGLTVADALEIALEVSDSGITAMDERDAAMDALARVGDGGFVTLSADQSAAVDALLKQTDEVPVMALAAGEQWRREMESRPLEKQDTVRDLEERWNRNFQEENWELCQNLHRGKIRRRLGFVCMKIDDFFTALF